MTPIRWYRARTKDILSGDHKQIDLLGLPVLIWWDVGGIMCSAVRGHDEPLTPFLLESVTVRDAVREVKAMTESDRKRLEDFD